ncbi:hypothetical protein LSM04_000604 [Trypanosoma melophagium]|uniref:uncharacterized protein n=1 Tax=Trypanosoma melophagium TaxID=715481 RepID=UPI00351A8546|nr:hypothetical protein LSM04_000604 [Trypanosoma melophagium]
MPLYNIIAKKLKPTEHIVQKVDDGKAMRSVLPFLSIKLGIPSMKNYVAFSCDENRRPVARLDMDTPLEEQGMLPFSYIYVAPIDATPKDANGEELPLVSDLKQASREIEEEDIPPPPTSPLPDDSNTGEAIEQEARKLAEEEAGRRSEETSRRAEDEARRNIEEEITRHSNGHRERMPSDFLSSSATSRDRVVSFLTQGNTYVVQENGNGRFGTPNSTDTNHHVHLNLVPDVIGVAAGQERSLDVEQHTPGEVAHRLAAVAEDRPLHYQLLLQLANFLLCHRPNRPQLFLWSHLQGKLGINHSPTFIERNEICRHPSSPAPTFAPVGDTTEERLSSMVQAGPAKGVLRQCAKVLLENKPDNPVLFMWAKLEAKVTKESIGIIPSGSMLSFSPDDPTKVALLREVARSSPLYNPLRSIVDLMFDKKPDAPELWMLDHLINRPKTAGTTSGRSSVAPFRPLSELTVDESRISDDDESDADGEVSQLMSAIKIQQREHSAPFLGGENKIKPRTKDISIQTDLTFEMKEVLKSSPVANASPKKSASPLWNTPFLQERSPRELLQLPHTSAVLLNRSRYQRDTAISDSQSSFLSPLQYEKYKNFSDSLRYTGDKCPSSQRRHSYSYDRSPVFREEINSEDRAYSQEGSGRIGVLHGELGPMPPCEGPPSPLLATTTAAATSAPLSGPPDLQYAARRREIERAETLYEYNWLLQRETLRNEQLQKEVELLRQEKEFRERMAQRDSSLEATLAAEAAARAQAEAEARLAALNHQGLSRTEEGMGLVQPPTELDVIRKRLELLYMEEARLRHLALATENSIGQGTGDNRVHDLHNPFYRHQ